jgi:RHS repeat-associated protein
LVNAEGKVIWQAERDDWGAVARQRGVRQPIRFQGQWEDEESGFYYNRFRYYDPRQGRYITQDPIGLPGGVNNTIYPMNPVGEVDPLGLTDINLFNPTSDTFIHGAANNVPNDPNVFTVGAHGSPSTIVDSNNVPIAAADLANMIKAHPKYAAGMTIELLSCNTGQGTNSYAKRLAKQLPGHEVKGADKYVWYHAAGNTEIAGMDAAGNIDRSQPGNMTTFKYHGQF